MIPEQLTSEQVARLRTEAPLPVWRYLVAPPQVLILIALFIGIGLTFVQSPQFLGNPINEYAPVVVGGVLAAMWSHLYISLNNAIKVNRQLIFYFHPPPPPEPE